MNGFRTLVLVLAPTAVVASLLPTRAQEPSDPDAATAELSPAEAAVAHPDRPAGDRSRDADRRPAEVLAFFGVEPGQRVADLMCGDGYYTEILSRLVGPDGHVWAQNNSIALGRFAERPLTERLARGFDNVTRLDRDLDDLGLPGELDAALLIRFYHDFAWMEADRALFNRQVFEALKPGGVLGIVDHHAEPGSGVRDSQRLHRVDAALVREELQAAGFVLEAESDLLAHPEDTRDWNVFQDEGKVRDKTDRFVYRFRKAPQ